MYKTLGDFLNQVTYGLTNLIILKYQ